MTISTIQTERSKIMGNLFSISQTSKDKCDDGTDWDKTTFLDRCTALGQAKIFGDEFNKAKT